MENNKLPNMYQVPGIRYIMFCMFVCGNLNRRPHVPVETIHTLSHSFEKYTTLVSYIYIDVARNSRTRILETVVNLCALVGSEIDSI